MGLFGGIFGAAVGALKGKSKGGQQDTSKPFHVHSSSAGKNATAASAGATPSKQTYEPRSDGSGTQDPTFMGKGQTEKFASLTDTSSVDRGGRSVSRKDEERNVMDIEPAMNPPMGVPVQNDLDKEGTMNSLYS